MNCKSFCLKINNPLRNILVPVIIFLLFEKLSGYLFFATLFKSVWEPYTSLWRPMEDLRWCVGMSIAAAIYALIISVFYVKICSLTKTTICLVGFTLTTFLLGRFFCEIYGYLMYPYDLKVMFLGMAQGLASMVVWAFICKKVFVINNPLTN